MNVCQGDSRGNNVEQIIAQLRRENHDLKEQMRHLKLRLIALESTQMPIPARPIGGLTKPGQSMLPADQLKELAAMAKRLT